MANGITPKLPFSFDGKGDFTLIQTYPELVKQNLKNLLLTVPGEKPFDSNFGVGIQKFIFEQNVSSTYSAIRSRTISQVSEYMPFLIIKDLRVESNVEDESLISVQVYYAIEPLEFDDILKLAVNNATARRF